MEHNMRLTAPEIANLWTQYVNETMNICIKKHILAHVQDAEVRSITEYALFLTQKHIEQVKEFLNQEKFPIPFGFTEQDVNTEAPRLFSDAFWLWYLHIMSTHGITGYAVALTTSTRKDQRDYFIQCSDEGMELYNRAKDTILSKGLLVRPPYISTPDKSDMVEKQSFLTGWFGERRPVNAIEISNIIFNMRKAILKKALTLGFSQVAESKQVRQYFSRVADIASKNIEVFSSILRKDNLSSQPTLDSSVTNTTVAPFSD